MRRVHPEPVHPEPVEGSKDASCLSLSQRIKGADANGAVPQVFLHVIFALRRRPYILSEAEGYILRAKRSGVTLSGAEGCILSAAKGSSEWLGGTKGIWQGRGWRY